MIRTNARGAVKIGQVLRMYRAAGGVPVVDIGDSDGNVYLACRFLGMGGGGGEIEGLTGPMVYAPPASPPRYDEDTPDDNDGAEVVFALRDGITPHAIVLGTLANGRVLSRLTELAAPETDADYSTQADYRDITAENEGARFLLSTFGDALLSTVRSGRPIRLETSAGGFVRIARAGDASERLLLAGPTRSYLDGAIAALDALGARVHALEVALAAALAAGTAVAVAEPAYVAFATPLTAFLTPTYTYTSQGVTEDSLVAAAVQIAAASKADEDGP